MKAIVYTRYGAPDVLQLKEVQPPVPKSDEILLKVRTVEVTKSDCELRSFRFPVNWFWLPLRLVFGLTKPRRQILGGYFAGEVEQVGADVSTFSKGEKVFGSAGLGLGAYGEYMCAPASATIVQMPENMSFEDAAAVPLGGLNAIHFMRKADIQRGESLLINGAGGSIGTHSLQIAKARGATVTAVDATHKEEMLRHMGADHFIDYTKEDFTSRGETYDVILDMVATSSYSDCVRSLNPKGRYLLGNPRISDMLRALFTSRFSQKQVIYAFAGETEEELLALKEMIEDGQITSIVDKIYPLEQAAEAHRYVETEQRLGAVVMSMGPDT